MATKTTKTALAAVALLAMSASASSAFTLGSMARNRPVAAPIQVASIAYPAVCEDLTCGVEGKKASDITPFFRAGYSAFGGWIANGVEAAQSARFKLTFFL